MTAFRRWLQLSAAFLLMGPLASAAFAQGQWPEWPVRPVNTIKDLFAKLSGCWKPPPLSAASPMDITVILSFNRKGDILGKPRITYESATATDSDRLAYRVAVMKALQRCTPMPFTEAMGGAVAGHPFAVQFRTGTSM